MKSNLGFSLIELIVVLILIGILAAYAIPRYINLTSQAKLTAINTIAAALGTASAENYAKRSANNTSGIAIDNCTDIATLLPGGLASNYSITPLTIAADTTVNCTLTDTNNSTVNFTATGIA